MSGALLASAAANAVVMSFTSVTTSRSGGSFPSHLTLHPCSLPSMSKLEHKNCPRLTKAPSFSFTTNAVTENAVDANPVPEKSAASSTNYYFLVANAKFMLDEEEHFKELLFERLRNYGERSKQQDFWLVIEPKFLDKFPDLTRRLRRPAVALVSTNSTWITFMKLRLDRVLSESYEADSLEEALASNPTHIEFEKPEKWVAPYPKYEYGWWKTFLPAASKES